MVYKRIFYGIIGMMWTVGAHCSVDGGKLTYQEFPKTENDLSFVELMRLKAEGYKPYFEKQVYYPIKLNLDDGGGAAGVMDGVSDKTNRCPDKLSTRGAQSASVSAPENIKAYLDKFNRSIVFGSMDCEYNKPFVGPDASQKDVPCLIYCKLKNEAVNHSGDVCFYANYKSGSMSKYENGNNTMVVKDGSNVYFVYYSEELKDISLEQKFNLNDKLGVIKNKEEFYYCIKKVK